LVANSGGGGDAIDVVLEPIAAEVEVPPNQSGAEYSVSLSAGAGDDLVVFSALCHEYPGNFVVDFWSDLGTGSDAAFLNVGSQARETWLSAHVSGGNEADLIAANVSAPTPNRFLGDIDLAGGDGLDLVTLGLALATEPQPNEPISVLDLTAVVSGGAASDLVGALLDVGLAAGELNVVVAGGGGSDFLFLAAQLASATLQSQLLASGGGGLDVAVVTPNVTVAGIERLTIVGQNSANQALSPAALFSRYRKLGIVAGGSSDWHAGVEVLGNRAGGAAHSASNEASALDLLEVDLILAELTDWLDHLR
jgi:hypothetical protein